MFCKFCGSAIDENSSFCNNCGAKVEEMNTIEVNNTQTFPEDLVDNSGMSAPKKKVSPKVEQLLTKSFFVGTIIGIVGVALFLGIVIVGLIGYGGVFLYQGYSYTQVLSTISIVLMIIGLCSVIAKCVLFFAFKIGSFPSKKAKKVLVILLVLLCLAFSIWGFADCSNANEGNYDGDDDYIYDDSINFYSIYYDCNCSYPWADWGSDYLEIDSNPYDYDSDYSGSTTYINVAASAIRKINTKLGFPSYLYDEMIETRAIDGRQSYIGTKASASWRYHPDSGLEVRYTKN